MSLLAEPTHKYSARARGTQWPAKIANACCPHFAGPCGTDHRRPDEVKNSELNYSRPLLVLPVTFELYQPSRTFPCSKS